MRRMAPQLKPWPSAAVELKVNFKYSHSGVIYIKNRLIRLNKHLRYCGEEWTALKETYDDASLEKRPG